MKLRDLRTYYNRCNPDQTLEPGDDRYVDIDALDREHPIRGTDWVARLSRAIELSDVPVFQLFTGLPGSGKSTELHRLAERLRTTHQILPIIVDADEAIDLSSPIDIPDIYFAILYYTDAKLLAHEGKTPTGAMREGYLSRFWHWVTETDVDFRGGDLKVDDAVKLVVELKTRPSLRARVRQFVASRLHPFLEQCHEELMELRQRAVALGFRDGLAIVFDSLEKLRGTSTNWTAVMESAERVFAGGAPHLRLPVHVLYTIPTALIVRLRIDEVHFLPMIKLAERDGTPFPHGVDAAIKMITLRIPDPALREILGPDHAVRLQRLIQASGGYPRELVRIMRNLLATPTATWPLSDRDVDRVLHKIADDYQLSVPTDAYLWLANVASNKQLALANDTQRELADRMLQTNVVLRYLNDSAWFDLHPAVRDIPGVRDAIAQRPRPAPPEPPQLGHG